VYAGFGLLAQPLWLWVLYAAYGLYSGMTEGVARAYAVDLAGPEHRATALGLHSLAIGLTTFVASAVAGQLWSHFGPAAPFLYGSATALLAAVALNFV
jgi:MFS family permease